jgi:hypothetical protein
MAGFPKRTHPYDHAASRGTDSPINLLVEGPPDVWRLAEAGYVGVSLLGADATGEQLRKLSALDRLIVIALDNDTAGRAAMERVQQRGSATSFRCVEIDVNGFAFRQPRRAKFAPCSTPRPWTPPTVPRTSSDPMQKKWLA